MNFVRPICGLPAYLARSLPGCWLRYAADHALYAMRKRGGIPMLAVAGGNITEGSLSVVDGRAEQAAAASGGAAVLEAPQPAGGGLSGAAETVQTAPAPIAPDPGPFAAANPLPVPEYSWTGYFMALGVMFLMLAMLWFGAKYLKNKGALRLFGATPDLAMETRLSLGAKKNLLVIRYRGKRLLLGVTDHHISLLDTDALNDYHSDETDGDPVEFSGMESSLQPGNKKTNFRELLNGLGKKR